MPAEGDVVTVDVLVSAWAVVGQVVAVGQLGSGSFGYFAVSQAPDATHVTLVNIANTAASAYLVNSPPGTVFPTSSTVGPAGLQGPTGTAGSSGAPADATYITQTPNGSLTNAQALSGLPDGLMELAGGGSGVVSSRPLGIADGFVAPCNGGLTAGMMVAATANGITTPTQAAARTALGLGTMATQNSNNVNITGGSITGVSISPGAGLVGGWIILQHQENTNIDSGAVASGSYIDVPLNVIVLDTPAGTTLIANVVTLPVGTYRFRWSVLGYKVDNFSTQLVQGVGTVVALGLNGRALVASDEQTTSTGWARATATAGAGQQFRLQLHAETTNGTNGFGKPNGFATSEIYATLEIEKETT
jgi:hypothetical protein